MSHGLKNEAKNLYKTYHFIREGDLYKIFQQYNASYFREGVLYTTFVKGIFTWQHDLHTLCLQRITLRIILVIFAISSKTPFIFRWIRLRCTETLFYMKLCTCSHSWKYIFEILFHNTGFCNKYDFPFFIMFPLFIPNILVSYKHKSFYFYDYILWWIDQKRKGRCEEYYRSIAYDHLITHESMVWFNFRRCIGS